MTISSSYSELDLFAEALRKNIAMLSIPGFHYLAEAVEAAMEEVNQKRCERGINPYQGDWE